MGVMSLEVAVVFSRGIGGVMVRVRQRSPWAGLAQLASGCIFSLVDLSPAQDGRRMPAVLRNNSVVCARAVSALEWYCRVVHLRTFCELLLCPSNTLLQFFCTQSIARSHCAACAVRLRMSSPKGGQVTQAPPRRSIYIDSVQT